MKRVYLWVLLALLVAATLFFTLCKPVPAKDDEDPGTETAVDTTAVQEDSLNDSLGIVPADEHGMAGSATDKKIGPISGN